MEQTVFHRFRDGEEVHYWDPVTSTVQGSLAEERRESNGRFGRDKKEFKLVQRLNRQYRLSLYEVLSRPNDSESSFGCEPKGTSEIEIRLSHLGARYPNIPGLSLYVTGLSSLEQQTSIQKNGRSKRIGPQSGKKIFDLLFWISSQAEMSSYWKFIILNKIARLVINQNVSSRWMQNSTTLLIMLGKNEVAYCWGEELLENKSAIRDSLQQGQKLAKKIFIQFYDNTSPYKEKVRRRGYARSSPVRPGSSKTEILEANTSEEALLKTGVLIKTEKGENVMAKEKIDVEELLLKIFTNSLEAFEATQSETMERLGIRKPREENDSAPEKNEN